MTLMFEIEGIPDSSPKKPDALDVDTLGSSPEQPDALETTGNDAAAHLSHNSAYTSFADPLTASPSISPKGVFFRTPNVVASSSPLDAESYHAQVIFPFDDLPPEPRERSKKRCG